MCDCLSVKIISTTGTCIRVCICWTCGRWILYRSKNKTVLTQFFSSATHRKSKLLQKQQNSKDEEYFGFCFLSLRILIYKRSSVSWRFFSKEEIQQMRKVNLFYFINIHMFCILNIWTHIIQILVFFIICLLRFLWHFCFVLSSHMNLKRKEKNIHKAYTLLIKYPHSDNILLRITLQNLICTRIFYKESIYSV